MSVSFSIRQAFGRMIIRWRHSVISTLSIAAGFLVLGSFLLLVENLRQLDEQVRGQVQIEVYLREDITHLQMFLLLDSINGFREVEGIQYKSQREALIQMEDLLGAGVTRDLEPTSLPASLLLSLKKGYQGFERVEKLALELKRSEGVEDVEFGAAWLKKAERIKSAASFVMVILGGIIVFALVMVMSNSLRSLVRSQSAIVRAMKLLGANIRETSVFLSVQGLLIGGMGALAGILCLRLVSSALASRVALVEFLPASLVLALIGWGMIWGVFGVLLSCKKQLQT